MSGKEVVFNFDEMSGSKVVPFSELAGREIVPGMIIGGFKVGEIETVVNFLAEPLKRRVCNKSGADNNELITYDRHEMSLDLLRCKGFYGKVDSPLIMIISPDLSIVGSKKGSDDIKPEDAISFLIKSDLISTGRGVVGTTGSICTLYIKEACFFGNLNAKRPYVFMKHRGLNQAELKAKLEALKVDSTMVWARLMENGMISAVNGGLLGLSGKR